MNAVFQGCEIQTETDQGPDVEGDKQEPSIKCQLHQSLQLVPAILLFYYPTPRNALSVRSLVHSLVRFSVRPSKSTASNAHNISATKRATGDPLVSNDRIF